MIRYTSLLLVFAGLLQTSCNTQNRTSSDNPDKPNIVFILADDLGYGDLSFLGQEKFETPNIDKLAREGLFFSQMYSGNTVCAPSRCALISGQHTGHTYIRGNKEIQPEGQHPIPDSLYTIFELLKDQGYATGTFGKWGLGYPGSEGDPMKQGIDRFFGFNCQRIGHNYYPYYLWDNDQKSWLAGNEGTEEKEYAPYLIQNQALDFIRQNKEKPFFLFRSTILPHAELKVPEEVLEKYIGKFGEEKPFKGIDSGDQYKVGGYGSQPHPRAAFAAMIELLDRQVGEIVELLDSLNIRDNTLIVFSTDNGPHQEGGADPDYFNSNAHFRGYKRDLYEGGIRVPAIFNWPGKITPGKTDRLSAFWDFYPTVMALTGSDKVPHAIDGLSLLPTLLGKMENLEQHEHLYWEFHELGGRIALRKGDLKLVCYDILKPDLTRMELYNIAEDPSETRDLSQQYPEKVKELYAIAQQERTPSEIFRFDASRYRGEK
ncbi:MAG: arylsulfatase [Spirosomataceae bacterium]